MIYGIRITTFYIVISLSLSLAAIAGELTIPNTFSNGSPADADQVNANFEAVKNAVGDNHQKILILSEPRSVTYSAMGFTPEAAVVTKSIAGNVVAFSTKFSKDPTDGSLALWNEKEGNFYHSVTLPSGVIITRMRARVSGAVEVTLNKAGAAEHLAIVTGTSEEPHTEESESLVHSIEVFPESYFIKVELGNTAQRFYSVAIEYAYPEP
jgi:hypothetical protein